MVTAVDQILSLDLNDRYTFPIGAPPMFPGGINKNRVLFNLLATSSRVCHVRRFEDLEHGLLSHRIVNSDGETRNV